VTVTRGLPALYEMRFAMKRTLLTVCLALLASTASAQTGSVFIEDMTSYEIRDAIAAGKTTAILFAGGIEQNGPHMALAKHNVIARYAAAQMAGRLGNALVFPVIPFSPAGDPVAKTGHMRFPGTISISSEVFLGLMRQIAQSAAAAGFRNIFLMGDHGGGQSELRLAAESVDADWRARGVRVYYVADVNTKAGQQVNAYMKERGIVGGGHAAVAETAQIMFLDQAKTLIHADKLAVSAAGPEATTGVGGNPSAATAEMGRQFLEYKITAGVDQIRALLAQK
jgi:creatinine amidohydrolase/Fe(II)-dependent formamide hydrolase-like protein